MISVMLISILATHLIFPPQQPNFQYGNVGVVNTTNVDRLPESLISFNTFLFSGSLINCFKYFKSPDSKVYKPLNPEAAPYIPSVPSTTSLLRAFSAPASPEYQDGLVKINPCSIDSPAPATSKVTRRRHQAAAQIPPPKFEEVEDMEVSRACWWERMRVPPPPRSGAKRARTLTTSTCGPDIEAALGSLATADYERFKQNLARATVIKRRKYD